MKSLTGSQEIAEAINFGKHPVLKLDLSQCDWYGLKGSICRIDMGEFCNGIKYYKRAQLCVYKYEKKLSFSSPACFLTANKSYSDFMNDVETAMSPIIKPDSEFIVVIYDSKVGEVYKVYLVETGTTHRHCQAPISVEPVDMKDFVEIADVRYKMNSKLQMNKGGSQ